MTAARGSAPETAFIPVALAFAVSIALAAIIAAADRAHAQAAPPMSDLTCDNVVDRIGALQIDASIQLVMPDAVEAKRAELGIVEEQMGKMRAMIAATDWGKENHCLPEAVGNYWTAITRPKMLEGLQAGERFVANLKASIASDEGAAK